MKKSVLPVFLLLIMACCGRAPEEAVECDSVVRRIEPPLWWVGMETPLQLLVQGDGISSWEVGIEGLRGVKITSVEKADSPNYLFINVSVSRNAQSGTCRLLFSKDGKYFGVPYEFLTRREGSAQRQGFTTADIIYLLMPDRFSNGDPDNDCTCDTEEKADYEAFFGRHGGDIKGICDHLDYMQELGVTAIWPNPLLEDNEPNSSYHGYACSDYYRVDPRFGTNEDYRRMVAEAHKRGIKVISDVVTNHCGTAHWWMKDLPFRDWIHVWPEYTHTNCSFSVQNSPYASESDRANMTGGWFDTSMPDMNLDNPYVLQYFKQWAVWLIEWADLDGFRVDTYPYNEKVPMSQWCAAVRKEYPDINIVGEVWTQNLPQMAYWQDDNPNSDGFDSNLPSIMDFRLQSLLGRLNVDEEHWDEGITSIYESISDDVYLHDPFNMLVFTGNHDIDRIADILGGDPRKVKMAMTLICTVRGIPQIYTGDEIMQVSRDRSRGHGGLRVEFDEKWYERPDAKDVHDFCRTLFNWRKSSEAVHKGATRHFLTRDNTYAYFRILGDETVFVFINNNEKAVTVPWSRYAEVTGSLKSPGVNVITGEAFDPADPIPAKSSVIIEFKYTDSKLAGDK